MYKQQSPISVSSTVWTILVTIIVLLIAASANAQTSTKSEETVSTDPVDGVTPKELRAPTSTRQIDRKLPAVRERVEEYRDTRVQNMETTHANVLENTAKRQELFDAKRQEWQTKIENRRTEIERKRAELASSTAARKAALTERAQERVSDLSQRIASRLTEVIVKMQNLSDRMRARAMELSERDLDVYVVLSNLNEVDTLLNSARDSLSGIDTNIQYAVTSPNPRTDWQSTRSQFEAVRDILKEVRELLRETLLILKNTVPSAATDNTESIPQTDNTSEAEQ